MVASLCSSVRFEYGHKYDNRTLPHALNITLIVLLVLASSIWLGGYVAIGVVALTARRSLDEKSRVSFFRALGRRYLSVGGSALVVALATGWALLDQRGWDALAVITAALALGLVVLLAVAVGQARRMTKLRQRALGTPNDEVLKQRVRDRGRTAGVLRGVLGLLSVTLVILGCVLAAT